MRHLGLMITKDDEAILGHWFDDNLRYFDEVWVLDGSVSGASRDICQAHRPVRYIHEQDAFVPYRTDHGLRWTPYRLIVDEVGYGDWITLCHSDEFFYHDPRKCCAQAERDEADGIWWFAPHFLPHPEDLPDADAIASRRPQDRFRRYHWSRAGSGTPWMEFRSFRVGPAVAWDPPRHGCTRPDGLQRMARFHPVYRHLKVFSVSLAGLRNEAGSALFDQHWQGVVSGRTGLPFNVCSPQDLFVAKLQDYEQCDAFSGRFDHDWNMGEEYR